MISLPQNLAQNISDKMMNIIPYNINIMNEKGIIIGSGDPKRINTIHEGALEALNKGSLIEIFESKKGVRPGVNTPILFDKKPIGVIGITGNPNEVKPFSQLVKVTAELLINQEYVLNQRKIYEIHKEQLLYELAYNSSPYSSSLIERCSSLNVNLLTLEIAIILQFDEKYNKKINSILPTILEDNEFMVPLSGTNIAIFIPYGTNLKNRLNKFLINNTIKIGVGLKEKVIGLSVKQAFDALNIGKKLQSSKNIYDYKNLSFISSLMKFKYDKKFIDMVNKLKKDGDHSELLKTLITYINMNGEIKSTSNSLHIHRNTLNYRLSKIYDITKKDPKKFVDLFQLYIAYIISQI